MQRLPILWGLLAVARDHIDMICQHCAIENPWVGAQLAGGLDELLSWLCTDYVLHEEGYT